MFDVKKICKDNKSFGILAAVVGLILAILVICAMFSTERPGGSAPSGAGSGSEMYHFLQPGGHSKNFGDVM